jgi:hypothetical protein
MPPPPHRSIGSRASTAGSRSARNTRRPRRTSGTTGGRPSPGSAQRAAPDWAAAWAAPDQAGTTTPDAGHAATPAPPPDHDHPDTAQRCAAAGELPARSAQPGTETPATHPPGQPPDTRSRPTPPGADPPPRRPSRGPATRVIDRLAGHPQPTRDLRPRHTRAEHPPSRNTPLHRAQPHPHATTRQLHRDLIHQQRVRVQLPRQTEQHHHPFVIADDALPALATRHTTERTPTTMHVVQHPTALTSNNSQRMLTRQTPRLRPPPVFHPDPPASCALLIKGTYIKLDNTSNPCQGGYVKMGARDPEEASPDEPARRVVVS